MRWPLRNQILLPMMALMLAALIGVSFLNAYLSVRRTRLRIESELAQVSETLTKSNFPLTNSVLQQMRGLVGAEFVLTDRRGNINSSSTNAEVLQNLPVSVQSKTGAQLRLAKPIMLGDQRFFHSGVELRHLTSPSERQTLHILYPEERYRQAWKEVVYPPLFVGAATIVLVVAFSLGIALRVTRPLSRLQRQVGEIGQGKFRSIPVPRRDDEIADLSNSINRMAETLACYERDIRRNEQLRTLGQLGSGIAHQMRNSVTGCKMAVELHARECPLACESLDVAMRQFELMEKFLQRFLSLGKPDTRPHQLVRLTPIVENVVSLVGPTAKHVGVELKWRVPEKSVHVSGDAHALEQLLVNLVLNGVEAALQNGNGKSKRSSAPAAVNVALQQVGDRVQLAVEDSGSGPSSTVESQLFEPFVTEKPDGTGLGLTVANEIATAHGGEILWHTDDGATRFIVDLPATVIGEDAQD